MDVDRVVAPPSGLPLIEIYYQATGSKAATIVLLAAFAFCMFGCATANIAGSSRQIWAASRDNAFPGSRWWSQISPRFQMPLNAAVLSAVVTMVREFKCLSLEFHPDKALVIRPDFPGVIDCLRVHGGCKYCFHDDLVRDTSRNSCLERTCCGPPRKTS